MALTSNFKSCANNKNKYNPQEQWVRKSYRQQSANNKNKYNPQEQESDIKEILASANNKNKYNPQELLQKRYARF